MMKAGTLAGASLLSAWLVATALSVQAEPLAKKLHAPREVPKELSVPEGQRLAFEYRAEGVQVYACQAADPAPPAWVLTGPDAKLFDLKGKAAGTHSAGPTWEAADKSSVVGKKLSAATPLASAIPWLLLEVASHAGHGVMSDVNYVQRLDTEGGLAPANGCDASHLGASARVNYSAVYAFYVADAA
ncbi:MAG TPA: DUF3455 domain-containing protein, partial [Polyangiales bacterium]